MNWAGAKLSRTPGILLFPGITPATVSLHSVNFNATTGFSNFYGDLRGKCPPQSLAQTSNIHVRSGCNLVDKKFELPIVSSTKSVYQESS